MTAKRDDCNIARVTYGDLEIWNQLPNTTWMLVEDCSVVAEVTLVKTVERRPDWSGRRRYKNVTYHRATIAVRVGWKREILLDNQDGGYQFYGGEVAVLREILKQWKVGTWWRAASWEADKLSREAGATSLQRIDAENEWNIYAEDREIDKQITLNHLRLVEKLEASR